METTVLERRMEKTTENELNIGPYENVGGGERYERIWDNETIGPK